jgi:hypothetical protein
MAAVSPGDIWAAIWEDGVWNTDIWEGEGGGGDPDPGTPAPGGYRLRRFTRSNT